MAKSKTNSSIGGNDYYRIRAKIGEDADGKPLVKNFYGTGKKDAEAKRDAYLSDLRAGLDADLGKQAVRDAMKSWLFEVKKRDNDLKDSSFERYEGLFRIHIEASGFASIRTSEVKSMNVQRYLNDLADKGYTHSQMKNSLKLLKMFFTYALEQGYILKYPCPKSLSLPGEKPKKQIIETFSDDEVARLKKALVGHRLRLLVLMGLGTGLRRGELLALKYEDIKDGKVEVSKTLSTPMIMDKDGVGERVVTIGQPKSESSNRKVPLPTELLREIESHRLAQTKERMAAGIGGKSEYIFTTATGQLYDGTNIHTAFARLLKKAGIPHKKFHVLRHTFATRLVRSNKVPLPVVQEMMGHSRLETTMIYVDVNDDDKIEAAQVLNYLFK